MGFNMSVNLMDLRKSSQCISKSCLFDCRVHAAGDGTSGTSQPQAPGDHDVYQMPAKKRKLDNFEPTFDDWKDADSDHDEDSKDDVDKYIAERFTDQMTNEFSVGPDNNFDVAKFWYDERIQCMFPMLSRVAIGILSIPASSASSERVFSTTGRVLEKRRTQLSSKSVDSIAYLHSKYHAD